MSVQNQKHTFFAKHKKNLSESDPRKSVDEPPVQSVIKLWGQTPHAHTPKQNKKKKHKGRPAVMFSQAFINQLTRTMWMSHVHFLAVISVYLWEVKAMKACRAFNRTKKHVTLYLDIVLIEILAPKSLCISKKHHSTWLIRLCYKSQPSWWTCF